MTWAFVSLIKNNCYFANWWFDGKLVVHIFPCRVEIMPSLVHVSSYFYKKPNMTYSFCRQKLWIYIKNSVWIEIDIVLFLLMCALRVIIHLFITFKWLELSFSIVQHFLIIIFTISDTTRSEPWRNEAYRDKSQCFTTWIIWYDSWCISIERFWIWCIQRAKLFKWGMI